MGIANFLFGDIRKAQPLNEPIDNSVPIQHVNAAGDKAIRNLPIARKCIGYIADNINKAEPVVVQR